MRKHILRFVAAGFVGAALMNPAWGQEPLWKLWTQASPQQHLAVHQLLRSKYPDLGPQLQSQLAQKYPQLELHVLKALVGFQQDHPALGVSVAHQLLQDLGDEPGQAALDVASAVLERYPNFPSRMHELRQSMGPGWKVKELLAGKFSGFRTAMLEGLSQAAKEGDGPPWLEVLQAVRQKHRGLGLRLALQVSRLMDQSYPGLPLEITKAREAGERPLPWLAAHHPDFLLQAARELKASQGAEIHQAVLDGLGEWERLAKERKPILGTLLLNTIQTRFPELPAEVHKTRMAAQRQLQQAVEKEFPELPAIVAKTMQEKHPQLLQKAAASLDGHFPGLRDQLAARLEQELPGLDKEVQGFFSGKYPELRPQVEGLLKS